MEKAGIIIITILTITVLGILFYKIMKGYVHEEFGKKWLMVWGNKVYFWQSLIFMSIAGTALVLYLLKWLHVLSF